MSIAIDRFGVEFDPNESFRSEIERRRVEWAERFEREVSRTVHAMCDKILGPKPEVTDDQHVPLRYTEKLLDQRVHQSELDYLDAAAREHVRFNVADKEALGLYTPTYFIQQRWYNQYLGEVAAFAAAVEAIK